MPFHSADENVKFDAGRKVLAGRHRELESSTVVDAGGNRDVQRLMKELGASALTVDAGFGPGFTPPAAVSAGAVDGHVERHGCTGARLLPRQTDRRAQLRGPLVGEECASNARQREIDRREVDGDFVGKAARIVAVLPRDDCDRIAAVWTESAPPHDRQGTIGIALGEVNGDEGVPALWRDDAVA